MLSIFLKGRAIHGRSMEMRRSRPSPRFARMNYKLKTEIEAPDMRTSRITASQNGQGICLRPAAAGGTGCRMLSLYNRRSATDASMASAANSVPLNLSGISQVRLVRAWSMKPIWAALFRTQPLYLSKRPIFDHQARLRCRIRPAQAEGY